jgi:hypothetical protein
MHHDEANGSKVRSRIADAEECQGGGCTERERERRLLTIKDD